MSPEDEVVLPSARLGGGVAAVAPFCTLVAILLGISVNVVDNVLVRIFPADCISSKLDTVVDDHQR